MSKTETLTTSTGHKISVTLSDSGEIEKFENLGLEKDSSFDKTELDKLNNTLKGGDLSLSKDPDLKFGRFNARDMKVGNGIGVNNALLFVREGVDDKMLREAGFLDKDNKLTKDGLEFFEKMKTKDGNFGADIIRSSLDPKLTDRNDGHKRDGLNTLTGENTKIEASDLKEALKILREGGREALFAKGKLDWPDPDKRTHLGGTHYINNTVHH